MLKELRACAPLRTASARCSRRCLHRPGPMGGPAGRRASRATEPPEALKAEQPLKKLVCLGYRMSQTDRQTDKATHWKAAVFEHPSADQWGALNQPPECVKEVHKKKEICPETGREHMQTHVVCHRQVRRSALSDWIKFTKWMPVIGDQHIKNSIAYIGKPETTAPGAQVEVVHGTAYMQLHELLLVVARCYNGKTLRECEKRSGLAGMEQWEQQKLWKNAAKHVVRDLGLAWINKLSNPALEKAWNIWGDSCMDVVHQEEGVSIIEDPLSPVFSECMV